MKKTLPLLLLLLTLLGYGQTPIYEFNFNSSLSNVAGNATFSVIGTPVTFVTDRNGIANNAVNLNGQSGTSNGGHLTANLINMPTGNSARSISFWIRCSSFVNNTVLHPFSYGTQAANQAFGIQQNTANVSVNPNRLEIYGFGPASNNVGLTAPAIAVNQWYHYVVTHDGVNSTKIYRNNTLLATFTKTWSTVGTTVTLGRIVLGTFFDNNQLNGALDDLKIYNTELTASQVAALYSSTSTVAVPTISNVSVTNVGTTSATINYTINANNAATTTEIRYAISPGGTQQIQSGPNASGSTNTPLSQNLTGLLPNTTYQYAVWAINSQGTVFSTAATFTTAPVTLAPAITNVTATNVTFNAATVNFNLNAFGSTTTYVVEYTTDVLAPWQTQNGGTTSVNASTPFQVQLTNLTPNETYFIRVKATNATGQVSTSSEIQINTPTPIVLTNVNDSNVTATTAQINYTLNTNGYSAFVELRYQAGTVFDSDNPFTTLVVNSSLTNNAATNYSYTITGLTPNTTYSYEFGVATSNAGGVETGENAAFTTQGISAQPTAPSPQNFCDSANPTVANLNATGTNIKWYNVATGGTPLPSTVALTNGTYYVSQTQSGSAESTRLAVLVNITIISPPSNVPANQTFCQSATLGNIQTGAGSNFQWYATQTGGAVLPNSTSISTGTYYLSQTISGCESPRTAVSVTVNVVNAPTAQAQTFCQSGTVANLTANGTQLKWYASATGGSQLANNTALATGTYYVSQTVNSCESSRTPVSVTVNQIGQPVAQSNQSFCSGATLSDVQFVLGGSLTWYTSATGGSILPSSTVMTSTTYYVTRTVASCESLRTAVSVTVNAVAAPTGNTSQLFSQGATVADLVANGTSIVWFASQADAIANVNPLVPTTVLVNNTTYYAMQTVNSCRSTSPLAVTVSIALGLEEATPKFNFVMYPNPAEAIVTVALETELKSVEIFSLHGQKVMATTSSEINVSELPSGIYFVKVQNQDGATAIQKLIVK